MKYHYNRTLTVRALPNSECSERKFEWIRIYKSCWSKTHSLFRRLILLELRTGKYQLLDFHATVFQILYLSMDSYSNSLFQFIKNGWYTVYLFKDGNREFWSQNVFLKCNFFEFTMDFINPELSIIDRNIKRSSETTSRLRLWVWLWRQAANVHPPITKLCPVVSLAKKHLSKFKVKFIL